jgi:hypothetical protein
MKLLARLSVAALAGLATPAGAQVVALSNPGQITTTYLNNFDTGVKNSGPVTFDASSAIDSAASFSNGVTTSGAFGLRSGTFPGLITANLSSSYNAVGLYFGNDDICCATAFSAILSAYNGATFLGSVSVAANMNDNVDQFIGLSSITAFDRVTIDYGTAGLYTFIDDFRLGTPAAANGAVPEPATWAMMLIGFGAIGGALRRRQKVAGRIRFA